MTDEKIRLEVPIVDEQYMYSRRWNNDFPKLQILTVEDLLNGNPVQLPPSLHNFKQAERIVSGGPSQNTLEF